jgi:hypothetical protein
MYTPFLILAVVPWLPPNPLGPGPRRALSAYFRTGDAKACDLLERSMVRGHKNALRETATTIELIEWSRAALRDLRRKLCDLDIVRHERYIQRDVSMALSFLRRNLGEQFRLYGFRLARWGVGLARPFFKLCQAAEVTVNIRW